MPFMRLGLNLALVALAIAASSGAHTQPATPQQQPKPAAETTGQSGNQTAPGGQAANGTTTGQKPAQETPICLTPAQERELANLRADSVKAADGLEVLEREIKGWEDDAGRIARKIAWLQLVIDGKVELSQQDKDDLDPVVEKADQQSEAKDLRLKIERAKSEYSVRDAAAKVIRDKLAPLEKIEKCAKQPETATGTGTSSTTTMTETGKPAAPVVEGCKNAADAEWLKEYRRLVAFYEKENAGIDGQLAKLGSDRSATLIAVGLAPEVLKLRIEEFGRQETSLVNRKADNQQVIEKFKGLIKAILEKKPCPPADTRISSPTPPRPPATKSMTDRRKKEIDGKKSKRGETKSRVVKRKSNEGNRSDDTAQTINTVIDIGIGIGLSRRGGDHERREGGHRGSSRERQIGGGGERRREGGGGERRREEGGGGMMMRW